MFKKGKLHRQVAEHPEALCGETVPEEFREKLPDAYLIDRSEYDGADYFIVYYKRFRDNRTGVVYHKKFTYTRGYCPTCGISIKNVRTCNGHATETFVEEQEHETLRIEDWLARSGGASTWVV